MPKKLSAKPMNTSRRKEIFKEKIYPVRKANFSNGVYEVVKKIPKGNFLSYKEVARLSGRPKAYRAVGNILNKNNNPQIPCHRVIKSNGRIGGYNKGFKIKESLLRGEGVLIKDEKVVLLKLQRKGR